MKGRLMRWYSGGWFGMCEWGEYILEDVIDKFIDYRGKTPKKTESGIPLITAKIVKRGSILEPNEFIAPEDYDSWMTRGLPEVDDIVLTTEAPLGEIALIKNKNVALAQRIITLRGKKQFVFNPFLKYYFQSSIGQYELQSRASGTTVFGIKAAVLRKVPVSLPSLPEQRAIASVLSSLDDKIDLLHRQNQTLEAMAETLFRQWFVEGADEGWGEGKLGDVIELFDHLRIPLSKMERDKKKDGKLYPYYGAAKIMDHINEFIFDGDYILLGEDGTVRTNEGYPVLQYATGKFWVNNHTHVIKAKSPYNNFFLWNYLRKKNIDEIITGAVQPKINQGNLKALDFPKFPVDLVMEFNEQTEPFFKKMNQNQSQIRTLEKLRDTLLPKLMSGEVRVKLEQQEADI